MLALKTKIIPVPVCNLKGILYVNSHKHAQDTFCIFENTVHIPYNIPLGPKMHFCPLITVHDRVSFINFITFLNDLVSHEKKWVGISHSLGHIYNIRERNMNLIN